MLINRFKLAVQSDLGMNDRSIAGNLLVIVRSLH